MSYISSEMRVPLDYPLRRVREMTDLALQVRWSLYSGMYSLEGRPSFAPEELSRALLLQPLYSVRSELQVIPNIAEYETDPQWRTG